MQICYIYVYKYKCLRNIGIPFIPEYTFNCDGHILNINSSINKKVPEGFWGKGITSVSGIIGENGVGKSTLLELLYYVCAEGFDSSDADAIIVYRYGEKFKFYIPNKRSVRVSVDGEKISLDSRRATFLEKERERQPHVRTLYYSGYFSPYFSYVCPRDESCSGAFNMSDGYLLVNELENYSNINSRFSGEDVGTHLQTYINQDNFRIVSLLLEKEFRKVLTYYELPKYVFFFPNVSGYTALKCKNRVKRNISIPEYTTAGFPSKNEVVASFVYYNIVNFIAENNEYGSFDYLSEWLDFWKNDSSDTLTQLMAFTEKVTENKEFVNRLERIVNVLSELFSYCEYNEQYHCFYINAETCPEKLSEWNKSVYKRGDYIVARYFDVSYSNNEDPNSRLSTGEHVVLKIFSRLYQVLCNDYRRPENIKDAGLLLLDEAEIGLHPGWQRMFIACLVDFINCLMTRTGNSVQIILSSHSPLMLSDLPTGCVSFLRKNENKTETILEKKNTPTSFGANIYDMFKEGYFLRSSIGEYAQKKIRNLYSIYNIQDKVVQESTFMQEYEELKFVVNNIADPFISSNAKAIFIELSELYNKEELKAQLRREIDERKDLLDRL